MVSESEKAAEAIHGYYPEHEKQGMIQKHAEVLSNFVDWIEEHDMHIVQHHRDEAGALLPCTHDNTVYDYQRLFASFFDIDLKAIEHERRIMLSAQRALNEQVDAARAPQPTEK